MAKERRDAKHRLLFRGEYQNPDGRYLYKYKDGKGAHRVVYSWTLTETDRPPKGKAAGRCLRAIEKEIQRDLSDGVDTHTAQKLTLNVCIEQYLNGKREIKASTRENYRYYYKHAIKDDIGEKRIAEIQYTDIRTFYFRLIEEQDYRPNSVEIINAILHPVFRTAIRNGYIRANPTDGVMAEIKKSQMWEPTPKEALTEEQQEVFISHIIATPKFHRWYCIMLFLLGTGCRIGEAVGMRWCDLDFDNNEIEVNHTLIQRMDEDTGKYTYHISTPKTKKSIRQIPMFQPVKEALQREYLRQKREGFTNTVVDNYSGFIFQNKNGKVLSPANVNSAIKTIYKHYNKCEIARAEQEQREPLLLPHFSAHILRHTFCTRLCENITDLKMIQKIMGHSSITVTINVYYTVTEKKKRMSFQALEGKILHSVAPVPML